MSIRKKLFSAVLASTVVLNTMGVPMMVNAEGETHVHNYVATVVAPTCETGGYTHYACDGCTDAYDEPDPTKPAKGHDYYFVDSGEGQHTVICRNDSSHTYTANHNWVLDSKVEPTCTEEGYSLYRCGDCKREERRDYVQSKNHDYVWQDNKNGTHTGTCLNNKNHVVTEYCREFYHDVVTPPTCNDQGFTTHTCERCGYVLVDSYVNPVEHNYAYSNNGNGTHTGVCRNNSTHTITESHDYKQTIVDPTCTTQGYTEVSCNKCGYTYKDNFKAPTTHKYVYTSNGNGTHSGICEYNRAHSNTENCTYVLEIVKPTCDNQGYDLHTCPTCGYSYKDNFVSKLGHDYVWKYNDNGTHTGVCNNNKSEVVTQPCDTIDKVVAPTCTELGYTEHTCKICNATYKSDYKEKLGHRYVWSSMNDGTHTGVCSNNSKHTTREACDYEDIVTPPTCTTNGYTTHRCKVCGYTYINDTVPMEGHEHIYTDLGNGTHRVTCKNDPFEINIIEKHGYTETVVNPTCTEKGYTLKTCKLCGYEEKDKEVPATGHKYVYTANDNKTHTGTCANDPSHKETTNHVTVDTVVKATCTTDGYTKHLCKVCEHTWSDGVVKATGHKYVWVIDKEAEVGVKGSKHEECTVCGKKKAAVAIAAKKATALLLPIISENGKNYQVVTWKSIPDAEYYKVYGAECGDSYEYLGTVTGTKFKRSGLKKGKYYKYMVKAYNTNGSKGVKIAESNTVHAVTTSGKGKNPTEIKSTLKSTKIKTGSSAKLKTTVKDNKVSRHIPKVRYISSNTSIARVSSNGTVIGVSKGTCYIYSIAQNGLYNRIKVTIK